MDYNKAVASVEELLEKIENPATDMIQSEKMIAQAREIIAQCREYLRSEREKD